MKPILATALLLVLSSWQGSAQQPPAPGRGQPQGVQETGPLRVTLGAYGLLYTDFDTFFDPASQSTWVLANAALGLGSALHLEIGSGLDIGVDVAFTRTPYERRPRSGTAVLASGHATVGTFLLNGRLSRGLLPLPGAGGGQRGAGGLGGLGTYASGSVGAVSYWLEDVGGVNIDLAFAVGGGLAYEWSSGRAAFIEWERFWAFHEREGVESGTANHSRFQVGVRLPLRR